MHNNMNVKVRMEIHSTIITLGKHIVQRLKQVENIASFIEYGKYVQENLNGSLILALLYSIFLDNLLLVKYLLLKTKWERAAYFCHV